MKWYYAKDGHQRGPVSGEQILECLRSGEITPQTLVWRDGLTEWVPVDTVAHTLAPPPAFYASPANESSPRAVPAEPAPSPYASPSAVAECPTPVHAPYDWHQRGLGPVFRNTLRLYFRHLWLILPAYLIIWLPLNFLSTYIEYHHLGPDNAWGAIRIAQALDWFFGIIAVVSVAHICQTASQAAPCSLGEAMLQGIAKWGKMWVTRLLAGLCILAGLILLVLPGLYLVVRLSLADYAVAVEDASGPRALARSFDLTKNRFWRTAGYLTLGFLVLLIPSAGTVFLYESQPIFENWIASALFSTALAIFEIFYIVYGFAIYKHWDAEN